MRQAIYLRNLEFDLSCLPIALGYQYWCFRVLSIAAQKAIIDKSGYLTGDPKTTTKIFDNYKTASILEPFAATALIATQYALFKHNPLLVYPLYILSHAAWCGYAAYKIHKGKWTVTMNHPKALPDTQQETNDFAATRANVTSRRMEPMRKVLGASLTASIQAHL